jgi:hypothetical protein
MTTSTSKPPITSLSIGGWTKKDTPRPIKSSSDTKCYLNEDVVLLQGNYVISRDGRELVVSATPASIHRKLAIRQINGRLEGWTAKSDTLSNKSGRS